MWEGWRGSIKFISHCLVPINLPLKLTKLHQTDCFLVPVIKSDNGLNIIIVLAELRDFHALKFEATTHLPSFLKESYAPWCKISDRALFKQMFIVLAYSLVVLSFICCSTLFPTNPVKNFGNVSMFWLVPASSNQSTWNTLWFEYCITHKSNTVTKSKTQYYVTTGGNRHSKMRIENFL